MPHSVPSCLRSSVLGLLLLVSFAGSASGQRSAATFGRDVSNGVGDMLHVWSSPLRADGGDWARAGLAGAFVVAVGLADRDINRWMVRHPSSAAMDGLRPFREGEDVPLVDLGSPKRILPIAGSLYVVGFVANSRAIRDAAVGCASALQAQAGIQSVALQVVQRERPLTSEGDPFDVEWGSGPWDRHSFFSGHASNVMSCVGYWTSRFEMGRAKPVLYALAVGIGLGRMADERHWASDIAAGSIFGYAVGTAVGRRARSRAERDSVAPTTAHRGGSPYVSGGRRAARVGWQYAF